MPTACALLLLSGIVPLALAWRASRHTSLQHAMFCTWLAWLAWTITAWSTALMPAGIDGSLLAYVALCLTAAAGIAVLGARRPGMAAWNFVVLGLLAVLLLPALEKLVVGRPLTLEIPRALFLGTTITVIVLNYLPTRLAPAALLLAAGCVIEIIVRTGHEALAAREGAVLPLARTLIALAPWAGLERLVRRPTPPSVFDTLWLDFRDCYGLVWGQRLREQFNRSAHHAGWPVILRWGGLRLTASGPLDDSSMQTAMLDVLRALLKRFGPEAE